MDATEEQMLRTLGDKLEIVDTWHKFTGTISSGWRPRDGSELYADDAAAHPYEVSHPSWIAITAAVSHLATLRDSLFHETGPDSFTANIHTHGQLTLVRGALENASMAVWLLDDDESVERIKRRLQVDYKERSEIDKVSQEIGWSEPSKTMDEYMADLTAVAVRVGVDPRDLKKRPGYGDIVRAAGKRLPGFPDGKTPFIVWKACSAIAHGETRGALAYLSSEVMGSPTPGTALATVTGNILLLATGTSMAVNMVNIAFNLFHKRAESLFTPLRPSWKTS